MKFVVVTGGVISGLGKGITASTIGLLLEDKGLTITATKIDPYLNVDAGTMSPFEHGECYVLEDGSEVDLDLGNYERFLGITLTGESSITTGKVYHNVINKERKGEYLGKTVQIIPHLTDEIISMLESVCDKKIDGKVPDVCVIELGGTIGDIEGMPFIEALRQMTLKHTLCFVHLSMLIEVGAELKTKPTQASIKELNKNGIFPNVLCIRSPIDIPDDIRDKLSMFCQIPKDMIICNTTVDSIYKVPIMLNKQNISEKICKILDINTFETCGIINKYIQLNEFNNSSNNTFNKVRCVLVGKYTTSNDTYLSIVRALEHAAFYVKKQIYIECISAELFEEEDSDISKYIGHQDVVIIPGGFGTRAICGIEKAIVYCKNNNINLLGICFGFQLMITALCKELGINATSEEFDNGNYKICVVSKVDSNTTQLGGTMRLGVYECNIDTSSLCYNLYNSNNIYERHRHRYEVDKHFLDNTVDLNKMGIKLSGTSFHKNKVIYELLEDTCNRFFVGCQFHPEFGTKLDKPHPLFIGLLKNLN